MTRRRRCFFLSLLAAFSLVAGLPALAESTFQTLGGLPGPSSVSSRAFAVTPDGSTVVGTSNSSSYPDGFTEEAFVWTQSSGMIGLGDIAVPTVESYASAVSADGSVVVGWGYGDYGPEAFRWTEASGLVSLGGLPGLPPMSYETTYAIAISRDGATIVGWSNYGTMDTQSYRWTSGTGMVSLGNLPDDSYLWNAAQVVSADGSFVLGVGGKVGGQEMYRWTESGGMVSLGGPEEGTAPAPYGMSADESVVVGTMLNASTQLEAFRWTEVGGFVGLGDLPGGLFSSRARAVSADGSVIVGSSNTENGPGVSTEEAFIWDAANGMRRLADVLSDRGVDLGGFQPEYAVGVSDDGRTIVGTALRLSDGEREAFIAVLDDEPPSVPGLRPAAIVLLLLSSGVLVMMQLTRAGSR